jgi:hypothetical protein
MRNSTGPKYTTKSPPSPSPPRLFLFLPFHVNKCHHHLKKPRTCVIILCPSFSSSPITIFQLVIPSAF